MERFRDRTEAGQQLAAELKAYSSHPHTVVLGLPRGGVPVAHEVARTLRLPLDVYLVRKLGAPDQPEFAIGAIAENGIRILNRSVIERLTISEKMVEKIIAKESQVLQQRQQLYRENGPPLDIQGRTVIVVDDGLATGATMLAAMEGLRQQQPKDIVIAIPVAPLSVCQKLQSRASWVVCLLTPYPFYSVGRWYKSFPQTTDQTVKSLLLIAPKYC
ncbi:MAG: phosphoribosyltransferase [Phormidesmis sp.]